MRITGIDRRSLKRHFRKHGEEDGRYLAFCEGQAAAYIKKPYRNPYPAGARHDEWARGYALSTDGRVR